MTSPMKSQVPIAAKPLAPIAPQPQAKLVPLAMANMPLLPANGNAMNGASFPNGKAGKGAKAAGKQQAQVALQPQPQQQSKQVLINGPNGSVIFANLGNANGQNGICQTQGQQSLIQPFYAAAAAASKQGANSAASQNGGGHSQQQGNGNQQQTFQIVPIPAGLKHPGIGMQMGVQMTANGQILVPFQMLANNLQSQQTAQQQQQPAAKSASAASNTATAPNQANGGQSQTPSSAPSNQTDLAQQQIYQQNLLNLQKVLQAQHQQQQQSQQPQQQQQQQQQPQQSIYINPFQQTNQLNQFLQQQNAQNQQQIMLNPNIMSMIQAAAKNGAGGNMLTLNGNLATGFGNGGMPGLQAPLQVKQEEVEKVKKPAKAKDPAAATSQTPKQNGLSPKKAAGSPTKSEAKPPKNPNESHNDTQMEVDGAEAEAETSNVTNSGTKKRGRPRLYEINPINGKSIKGKFLNDAKPATAAVPQQPPQPAIIPHQNGLPMGALGPASIPVTHLINNNLLNAIYPSPSPTTSTSSASSSASSYAPSLHVNGGKSASNGVTKTPEKAEQGGARALRPIKAKQDGTLNTSLNSSQTTNEKGKNGSFSERQNESSPSKRNKLADESRAGELNSDSEQQKENKETGGALSSPTRRPSPSKAAKRAKEEDEAEAKISPYKGKVQRLSPHSIKSTQVVLTHVIDGYVIKESSKPFPVKAGVVTQPASQMATGEDEMASAAAAVEPEQLFSSTPKKGQLESVASPSKKSPSKKQSHNESSNGAGELMDCSMTSNKSCSKSSKSHKCRHHKHKHHRKHSRSKLDDSAAAAAAAVDSSQTVGQQPESASKSSKSKSSKSGSKSSKNGAKSAESHAVEPELPSFSTTPLVRFANGASIDDQSKSMEAAAGHHQFLSPQHGQFIVYNNNNSHHHAHPVVSSSPTGQYGQFATPPPPPPSSSLSFPVMGSNALSPAEQQLPGGDPTEWNCDEVYQFVKCVAGMPIAQLFKSQEVDGSALTLIRDDHLVNTMQIKLGPALKIMSKFNELKEKFSKQQLK